MSQRLNRLAAPLALALLSATPGFAVTLTTPPVISGTPFQVTLPTLQLPTCYTRAIFASPSGQTTSQLIARRCEAGEKAGTVKVVYAG